MQPHIGPLKEMMGHLPMQPKKEMMGHLHMQPHIGLLQLTMTHLLKRAQSSKSTKTKQTASQPLSTSSQPAYTAFGQTASQPAPNNRSEATTQPPTTRSRAKWLSSSSQPSFHTPKETWDSLPSQASLLSSILFIFFLLLLLDHLTNCWILVMQPSASVSTSGVPSQGSGAAATRGFKGKTYGVSRPTKFQPVGGKSKKAAGNGTKSIK
nr:hypothetical protein CFP56_75927 [Quercus suber]